MNVTLELAGKVISRIPVTAPFATVHPSGVSEVERLRVEIDGPVRRATVCRPGRRSAPEAR